MAAIRVLSGDGFHGFKAIHKKQEDGTTSDYKAHLEHVPAYVEVKNLHTNDTIFDVFIREIGRAYERDPSRYAFHLCIEYAYDHLPTGEQERTWIRPVIGHG
jgi:hypothetical protein